METARRVRGGGDLAPGGAPDDVLVRLTRGGSLAAFEVLVRRHALRVRRVTRSILRNDADAEDAAQQAFLHVFVALRRREEPSSFAPWLARIAANAALLLLRRRRDRVDGVDPAGAPSSLPGPEEEAAAEEALRLLGRAVARLPVHHRETIRLRHVEGLSIAQTAARLGITPTAVKVRLHRTRRVLRRAVATPEPLRRDDPDRGAPAPDGSLTAVRQG